MEFGSVKKGDYIVYGRDGICLVEDVCDFSFSEDIPKKPYVILKPQNDKNSLIYIPHDNELLLSRLRTVVSKDGIQALLEAHKKQKTDWPEDRKQRILAFREILSKSDPLELLGMIRCIYQKDREFAAGGKKLSASDKDMLQNAERYIRNEFSFSLGIAPEDVASYIQNILQPKIAE